jgi:hypothetical protein
VIISTLAQFALERGVEQIDFKQLWTAIDDALDHSPEGSATSGW